MTAAHCVVEGTSVRNAADYSVRLGEHSIERDAPEDAAEEIEVAQIVPHQNFDPRIYKNDIALLKLKRKVRSAALFAYCIISV